MVRASDKTEDIEVQTEAITSRFKFFEQYQQNQPEKTRKVFRITPPRDGQVKVVARSIMMPFIYFITYLKKKIDFMCPKLGLCFYLNEKDL